MQLQSHAADPENPQAGKAMLAQANSRRALGDLSNLVGGFKAVNVGKDAAQVSCYVRFAEAAFFKSLIIIKL